jgi:hypothetical protein
MRTNASEHDPEIDRLPVPALKTTLAVAAVAAVGPHNPQSIATAPTSAKSFCLFMVVIGS